MTRSARRFRLGIAVGFGVIVASCRPSSPPTPAKPDLVLIVVASLRADHVGAYGYGAPTTPHLDALARAGVRFAEARVTSSWTLPSVASMLTALYPAAHGVDHPASVLSDAVATMPAALHAAGYATAAISADPCFVTPAHGLGRGFDDFLVEHGPVAADARRGDVTATDPFLRSFAQVSNAAAITTRALDWVTHHDRSSTPYFLYVHYFDPHAGYFPPPEYARRFQVEGDERLVGDAQWNVLEASTPPALNDTATLLRLYDGEIAYADDQIGTLIDTIRARGRSTVFVVVGDHGEEFNDHGGLLHGRTLFDEVLRVPWIIAGPGIGANDVRTDAVSLVSLWPTVAALLGVDQPLQADGIPLIAVGARQAPKAQNVFADLETLMPGLEPRHHRAVVSSGWKLLLPPAPPAPNLFDLGNDRLEQIGVPGDANNRQGLLEALLKMHNRGARTARVRHPATLLAP